MVHALSIVTKKHKACTDYEDWLDTAVTAYQNAKQEGNKITYCSLENHFEIPYKTIQHHVKGENMKCLASATSQSHLTPTESQLMLENALYLAA